MANEKHPIRYADQCLAGQSPTVESETLSPDDTMGETMMLGLRLADGVSLAGFAARFGVTISERFGEAVSRNIEHGLLEQTSTHLRLTERGVFFASDVMADFL